MKSLQQYITESFVNIFEAKKVKFSSDFMNELVAASRQYGSSFDKKTGIFTVNVQDWVVTWNHYEKGHGDETSKTDQQQQISTMKNELVGYKGRGQSEIEEVYIEEFGVDNYTVEFQEDRIDKNDQSIPNSGSKGYRLSISMIFKPK